MQVGMDLDVATPEVCLIVLDDEAVAPKAASEHKEAWLRRRIGRAPLGQPIVHSGQDRLCFGDDNARYIA